MGGRLAGSSLIASPLKKLANEEERFEEAAGTQLDIFNSFIGLATKKTWRWRRDGGRKNRREQKEIKKKDEVR